MRIGSSRLLGEALDGLVEPAAVVGDALEHGADQVGVAGLDREVVQAAAGVAVVDRGALAREPGREDHAAAARRRALRQLDQALVVAGSPRVKLSRSQRRQSPAASWLLATR